MSLSSEMIDKLILAGALEVAGIHETTGELLYSFTPKLKQVAPEIFNGVIDHFYTGILHLWELGFLDMDITEREPSVAVNYDFCIEENMKKLNPHELNLLENLMKQFSSDN
jgi:hypothetical protein